MTASAKAVVERLTEEVWTRGDLDVIDELVAEMQWRGMVVPSLYTRMAAEFQDLIAAGDYAAWVATGGTPRSRATRAGRHLPRSRA